MLNPYMVEKFGEEKRREAEAFVARQRLIAQAERNRVARTSVVASFIVRLARAIHLQVARSGSFSSALRKV